MIDLIIFDLDGVLIDTEHIHYSALCDSINEITQLSHEEIRKVIITDGSTTKSKLRLLKSKYEFTDEICEKINSLKQQRVAKEFSKILPEPELTQMISILSKKYHLAIGSNSRCTSVNTIVDSLGIRHFFRYVISIDDVGIEKPDPAIFLYIMDLLDVHPNNTLILEDSPRGIDAAQRSGANVLITTCQETTLENIENEIKRIETDNSCTDGGSGDQILGSRI